MNKKILYALWGFLYILCAGLGFIPNPAGAGRVILVILGVAFFLPGAALLYQGIKEKDRKTVTLVRNLAIGSLVLTLIALVVNFLSVGASETAGNVLYGVLILVSSPMVCSQYWALSMFLWACLLSAGTSYLKKNK